MSLHLISVERIASEWTGPDVATHRLVVRWEPPWLLFWMRPREFEAFTRYGYVVYGEDGHRFELETEGRIGDLFKAHERRRAFRAPVVEPVTPPPPPPPPKGPYR